MAARKKTAKKTAKAASRKPVARKPPARKARSARPAGGGLAALATLLVNAASAAQAVPQLTLSTPPGGFEGIFGKD